jgi:hypothetical protein
MKRGSQRAQDQRTLKVLLKTPICWSEVIRVLAECLAELRSNGRKDPAAESLAEFTFGQESLEQFPILNDLAAIVLATAPRVVVHQVRPAVAQFVDETDLHSIPAEPPRLLRRSFLFEARRPEAGERLFGNVVAVGGYPVGAAINIFWSTYPNAEGFVAQWRPKWSEAELAATPTPLDVSPLLEGLQEPGTLGIAGQVGRFLIVLGLLLDSENVPLRIEDEQKEIAVGSRSPTKKHGSDSGRPRWVTRHLFLDEISRTSAPTSHTDGVSPSDRLSEQVRVRGHLKRQRHGPGLTKTRWIYVPSYEARRWVAPQPVRVIVSTERTPASQ